MIIAAWLIIGGVGLGLFALAVYGRWAGWWR